jgi:hypothetical protein
MGFTVSWLDSPAAELFELWSDPELRDEVVTASRKITAALELSPNEVGESRPDNVRIIFAPPLAAMYEVLLGQRQVNILRLWYYHKR